MRQIRWLKLIKDYELEVHYHPGKVNVVMNALSCKAHCNYLPVVRLTREESSTWVLPDLSLHSIILTPLLREAIIVVQKNDEGMTHLSRRLLEGDLKVNLRSQEVSFLVWLWWIIDLLRFEFESKTFRLFYLYSLFCWRIVLLVSW
jgi:hypothetical protein